MAAVERPVDILGLSCVLDVAEVEVAVAGPD
jgi:hypothetical protein